jgi:hypothetical protein
MTTNVEIVQGWSHIPIHRWCRWLWVPAFAGTTITRFNAYTFTVPFGQ